MITSAANLIISGMISANKALVCAPHPSAIVVRRSVVVWLGSCGGGGRLTGGRPGPGGDEEKEEEEGQLCKKKFCSSLLQIFITLGNDEGRFCR